MKPVLLESKEDIESLVMFGNVYIVGAAQYGERFGIALNNRGIKWKGYIDLKGDGSTLNGKRVMPYSFIYGEKDSKFLVSSIRNTSSIVDSLLSNEIPPQNIYVMKDHNLVFSFCGEGECDNIGEFTTASYGDEDPDKIYMIMESHCLYEGPFYDMSLFLRGCEYAERNGFIPVIDRVQYPSFLYVEFDHLGKCNPWEIYFEQPAGVTLDDVMFSKRNVRRYDLKDSVNFRMIGEHVEYNNRMSKAEVEKWRSYTTKYMRPSDEMKNRIRIKMEELQEKANGDRVLGVSIREGFILESEAGTIKGGGVKQPNLEQLISDSVEYMERNQCNKVFLACQYKETVHEFEKIIGKENLIFHDRERDSIITDKSKIHRYKPRFESFINCESKQKQYIEEVYMLSSCDALLCGRSSGSSMAAFLSKCDVDHIMFYDLGKDKL